MITLAFNPNHQKGTPPARCTVPPCQPRTMHNTELSPMVEPWVRELYDAAIVYMRILSTTYPHGITVVHRQLRRMAERSTGLQP